MEYESITVPAGSEEEDMLFEVTTGHLVYFASDALSFLVEHGVCSAESVNEKAEELTRSFMDAFNESADNIVEKLALMAMVSANLASSFIGNVEQISFQMELSKMMGDEQDGDC